MNKLKLFVIVSVFLCFANDTFSKTAFSAPPAWAKSVVWYQIFVERFNNGDKTNDPANKNTTVENMNIIPPANWKISNWTGDWYARDSWMQNSDKSFPDLLQYRRYGGDLQGVINKLDYLNDLGVTAIFLNPINDAPSLHKYDARNYHHIDINFGPDPEGDLKIMTTENPADPTTWKWTSADKLFLKLVDEAHKRNMRIIMDYSWNHTGTNFWAWLDILKNQSDSPYKSWYNISTFDNPQTPVNEFKYDGWYGNAYMPEFRKTDIEGIRTNGKPYIGNMDNGVKQHVFDVTKRWLAPNGDATKGIDGFRLDVADQIGLGFWRDYRKFVRSVNEEAYLIGEIWWEKWPKVLMNPVPYMQGDMFDAVMYYQVYRPARYFFAKTKNGFDGEEFKDSLLSEWGRLKPESVKAMMNVSSSHDAPRLLTDFYNDNDYKYHANPLENKEYKTGKPDKESYKRLQLYLVHLFTTLGAPQIWNGEEMGMWGADDPLGRKPLWWKEMKFAPENRYNFQNVKPQYDKVGFDETTFQFYKKLIKIRKENIELIDGELTFLETAGKKFSYERSLNNEKIVILFNTSDIIANFELEQGNYLELLSNKKFNTYLIKLKPLQSLILKKLE